MGRSRDTLAGIRVDGRTDPSIMAITEVYQN